MSLSFPCEVSEEELKRFLELERLSGEELELEDLENEYILINEVYQICFLKRLGIRLDSSDLIERKKLLLKAKTEALRAELELAFQKGDVEWIRYRLEMAFKVLDLLPFLLGVNRSDLKELEDLLRMYAKKVQYPT
ncbi:hypothetical protein IPA_06515 [Ignicoccus pacificus DSM 13166]|uniref:Uncharacterized protein n=1 Tax=Ignicoccus pacificus DSM 13166 TaxID=940294 RepID=A0A977PK83_9CREN|nr:hypothetical protein IPA_06515 [Ignicoccus pacificus DSM 13166]